MNQQALIWYVSQGNDSLLPADKYGPIYRVEYIWAPDEDQRVDPDVVEFYAPKGMNYVDWGWSFLCLQ